MSRPTKYKALYEAMDAMQIHDLLLWDIPQHITPAQFLKNIWAQTRRNGIHVYKMHTHKQLLYVIRVE